MQFQNKAELYSIFACFTIEIDSLALEDIWTVASSCDLPSKLTQSINDSFIHIAYVACTKYKEGKFVTISPVKIII